MQAVLGRCCSLQGVRNTSWVLTLIIPQKQNFCTQKQPHIAVGNNHERQAYMHQQTILPATYACAMTHLPAPLLLPRPSKVPARLCPRLQPATVTAPLYPCSMAMRGYGNSRSHHDECRTPPTALPTCSCAVMKPTLCCILRAQYQHV